MTPQQKTQLTIIEQFPARLETAIAHLTPEQLHAHPIEGEWSIQKIVHHLADSHMNSFIRLKLMLTEENPPLKPYAEPLWALTADVSDVPIAASIQLLHGLHQRWVTLFRSLDDDQWQRTGFHSELKQTLTPVDLLQIYAQHCQDHMAQIERVLSST